MPDADFITIIYFYLFLLQSHVLKLESLMLMSSENLYQYDALGTACYYEMTDGIQIQALFVWTEMSHRPWKS